MAIIKHIHLLSEDRKKRLREAAKDIARQDKQKATPKSKYSLDQLLDKVCKSAHVANESHQTANI